MSPVLLHSKLSAVEIFAVKNLDCIGHIRCTSQRDVSECGRHAGNQIAHDAHRVHIESLLRLNPALQFSVLTIAGNIGEEQLMHQTSLSEQKKTPSKLRGSGTSVSVML